MTGRGSKTSPAPPQRIKVPGALSVIFLIDEYIGRRKDCSGYINLARRSVAEASNMPTKLGGIIFSVSVGKDCLFVYRGREEK